MIQQLSRFISNLLSPLLMPTYGVIIALWVSILCYQSLSTRLTVLFFIFGTTCLLPLLLLFAMQTAKMLPSKFVDHKERTLPYTCAIVCYLIATYYLTSVHAPTWLTGFMLGVATTTLVSLIINLKWKISAHAAGMGGIVALLYFLHFIHMEAFNSLWILCLAIIMSGVVGSVRLYMQRHSLAQVLAGFANGFLCVHILINIFY